MLSPIRFTIYIDGLLEELKLSGIGCHMGHKYAVEFSYAEALLPPSLSSLKWIIKTCEDYDEE